jgi:hypothetical protein
METFLRKRGNGNSIVEKPQETAATIENIVFSNIALYFSDALSQRNNGGYQNKDKGTTPRDLLPHKGHIVPHLFMIRR